MNNGLRSSRPKVILNEVMSPGARVMSPERVVSPESSSSQQRHSIPITHLSDLLRLISLKCPECHPKGLRDG